MLELPAALFHFGFLIHMPGNVLVCFSICPSTVFYSFNARNTKKSYVFCLLVLVCKCSTGCLFLTYIINPKGLWSPSQPTLGHWSHIFRHQSQGCGPRRYQSRVGHTSGGVARGHPSALPLHNSPGLRTKECRQRKAVETWLYYCIQKV